MTLHDQHLNKLKEVKNLSAYAFSAYQDLLGDR